MNQQIERITGHLLACGLTEKEFNVLERKNDLPQIILYLPIERKVALAPTLAEYFYVEIEWDGEKPETVIVRAEGQSPTAPDGIIVFQYRKGLYQKQKKTTGTCKRCHESFPVNHLTVFEYNLVGTRLCFQCLKTVIDALLRLPLEKRSKQLETSVLQWAESEAQS